jgi:hypothetical protein
MRNASRYWLTIDLAYQIDIAIGYKLKEVLNKKLGMTQERPAGKPPTRQDYWDGKDSGTNSATMLIALQIRSNMITLQIWARKQVS